MFLRILRLLSLRLRAVRLLRTELFRKRHFHRRWTVVSRRLGSGLVRGADSWDEATTAAPVTSHTVRTVGAMPGVTHVESFTVATGSTAEAGTLVVGSMAADTDGRI